MRRIAEKKSFSWRYPRAILGLWLMAGVVTGCATERSMYRGVGDDRSRAYEVWKEACAQEEVTRPCVEGELSMADALKLALSYNKSLQAVTREQEIARGVVMESYGNILPSVTGRAEYARLDQVSQIDIGGTTVAMGDEDNYSARLQVTQPFFRGGQISASLRAARWRSLLADDLVREAVQETIYETAQAYYDTLLARHLYEVNRAAVESARAYLQDVQVKHGQGVASKFDILRAQVDVSLFEAQMIQQQNRINTSRTRLLLVLGASQESNIILSDHLEFIPLKPVLKEAVRLAYQNRPDIYRAELNIKLQGEALRIARSGYWPAISAFFEQAWSKPDPHSSSDIDWGDAWTAGVAADWNIFDGLRREGRVSQEKERLKQQEIELVGVEEQALLEVRQSIFNLRDAEEFVQSQSLNLERAREAVRLAQIEYRQGIIESVAVTESRSALTQAEGLYYDAVYAHTLARLGLQRAMGTLAPVVGDSDSTPPLVVRPGVIEQFVAQKVKLPGDPPQD